MSVLGRVENEKGVDLALHAIRILRSEGIAARLRIIGDSLDGAAYRSVIDTKIQLLDLTEAGDFIGLVRDKIALLRTSNVFAGCFIRSEPFGLVMLEAMATGLSVVAPDKGAAAEIINRAERPAGLLYRTNDSGQLADKVRWLYERPDEARRIGQAEHHSAARYFHTARLARDVRAVLKDAILMRRKRQQKRQP